MPPASGLMFTSPDVQFLLHNAIIEPSVYCKFVSKIVCLGEKLLNFSYFSPVHWGELVVLSAQYRGDFVLI